MLIKTNSRVAMAKLITGLAVIWLSSVPVSGQVLDLPPQFRGFPDRTPFLTFKEGFDVDFVGSDAEARAYYQQVDPQGLRTFDAAGNRKALRDWWLLNGFGPNGLGDGTAKVVRTAYMNNNDLGFGRDMYCLQRNPDPSGRFDVACYVTNYSKKAPDPRFGVDRLVLQDPGNADLAFGNKGVPDRSLAIATVCMEYSAVESASGAAPTRVVKFFVYDGGDGTGFVRTSANLDNNQSQTNAEKFVPKLCLACHGGVFAPQRADLAASFIGFDLESFRYSTQVGASRAEQEPAFKLQNLMVLETARTNPNIATVDLIQGWYHLLNVEQPTQDSTYVPVGWTDPNDPIRDLNLRSLYNEVVKPGCRSCHAQQRSATDGSLNWISFAVFQGRRGSIQDRVCSAAVPPQKVMPHAYVTYLNFWRIGRPGPHTLALFSDNILQWTAFGQCQ